jgi:hypothetical protein
MTRVAVTVPAVSGAATLHVLCSRLETTLSPSHGTQTLPRFRPVNTLSG